MTCSVGFRSPRAQPLAGELLQRLADVDEGGRIYRDAAEPACSSPGRVPVGLLDFARSAVEQRLREPHALERALGEALTEPKPRVWFEATSDAALHEGVRLDRRSRMLYDDRHVFINGEAFRAAGRDARLLRRLADERRLLPLECRSLSGGAAELLQEWLDDGWLQPLGAGDE